MEIEISKEKFKKMLWNVLKEHSEYLFEIHKGNEYFESYDSGVRDIVSFLKGYLGIKDEYNEITKEGVKEDGN